MAIDFKALAQREAEAKSKALNSVLMSQREIEGSILIRLVIDPDGRYHTGSRWFFPLVEYFFTGLNEEDPKKKTLLVMPTLWHKDEGRYEVKDIVQEYLKELETHDDKSVRQAAKKLSSPENRSSSSVFDCIIITSDEDSLEGDEWEYNEVIKGLKVTNGVRSELGRLLETQSVHQIKTFEQQGTRVKRVLLPLDPSLDGAWSMTDPGTVFRLTKSGEQMKTKYKVEATDYQVIVPPDYEQPSLIDWVNNEQVKPEAYILACLDYLVGLTDDVPNLEDYKDEPEPPKNQTTRQPIRNPPPAQNVRNGRTIANQYTDDDSEEEDKPVARNRSTGTTTNPARKLRIE